MMLLMVGLLTCLGVNLIALCVSNTLLPKLKNIPALEHYIPYHLTLGLQGVLSILVLPIINKADFVCLIGFDNSIEARFWGATEFSFLQVAAGLLALVQERLLVENQNFASQLENSIREQTAELHQEIAERKQLQAQLEKSLALQRAILESTADGILVIDNQGNVAGFNQKFVQMWQIPEALLNSGNFREAQIIALKQLENPKKYIATIRKLRLQPDTEINDAIALKNGKIFNRYSQPQRINNKTIGRIWSFRDITTPTLAKTTIHNQALYHLKRGNQYDFSHSNINSQTSELLILKNSLYHALERQEFKVFYQPQVNITTGKIVKMEALLRWEHPQLGSIPPEIFIPIAEETGLIVPIGEWILRTACAQNKSWQDSLNLPTLKVAVNISARQFQQPNLVKVVTQILLETQLNPDSLDLEITESSAMQNVTLSKEILGNLRNTGISISIDDFGTGYCSLSYLKNFPIHCLKIDKSFVYELAHESSQTAIITAIITLARSLNLTVIAEGVETEEQRKLLQILQCELMQGYLFSHPLPAEDATKLLRKSFSQRFNSYCLNRNP